MVTTNDIQITEAIESRKAVLSEGGLASVRILNVDYDAAYLAAYPNPTPLDPEWVVGIIWDPDSSIGIVVGDLHPTATYSYVKSITASHDGGSGVRVEVVYESPEHFARADNNGEVWEFEWTAKQIHITSTPYGQTHAPSWADCGAIIGADGEEVLGVDIQSGGGTLKITKALTSYPSGGTLRSYRAAAGCVNLTSFGQGMILAKEALCTGVNFLRVNQNLTLLELSFQLGIVQLSAAFTLIDASTVTTDIDPFQYCWFRHAGKAGDKGDGTKVKQNGIESVHVATLYPTLNFASTFNLEGPTYGA